MVGLTMKIGSTQMIRNQLLLMLAPDGIVFGEEEQK
jgi:hypothetical protein